MKSDIVSRKQPRRRISASGRTVASLTLAALFSLTTSEFGLGAQVPSVLSYQGQVSVQGQGANYTGPGQFKFALLNANGQTLWSHDGTSTQGSAPQSVITLNVNKGYFSLLLGDTSLANMQSLSPAVFQQTGDMWLRVWFDDGVHGLQQLSPDQRLASVAFAMVAGNAGVADGSIGTTQLANGAVTSDKIAPNALGSDQISDHLSLGAPSAEGSLTVYGTTGVTLRNLAGADRLRLDSDGSGHSGEIVLGDKFGNQPIKIKAHNGNAIFGGPEMTIASGSLDPSIRLSGTLGGLVQLYDINGAPSIGLAGLDGSAKVRSADVANAAGDSRVKVLGDGTGNGGEIVLRDQFNNDAIRIKASNGNRLFGGPEISIVSGSLDPSLRLSGSFGGAVQLFDLNGAQSISLTGLDGHVRAKVVEITGGSDLSEAFDIEGRGREPEPGMIVCIDPANPGRLALSERAYDRTAAGIISGAGGVNPGMIMGQSGTLADGQYPVALSGRVYCRVDADQGAIQPGDMITTSDVPGHGMKVTDPARAHGAIIGKAMTGLEGGQGMVLVLVSLH